MRFVLKYGGSSLSTVTKVKRVAKEIAYFKKTKADQIVVVVSAMGKTTSALIELAKKTNKNSLASHLPDLICLGENISAGVLSLALEEIGEDCKILSANQIKLYAKGDKNNAVLTSIDTKNIINKLEHNKIVIVPGFQAVNEAGELCCLGRGSSDLTAIALANVLDAKVIINTDVKGFYSCDPNLGISAKRLLELNIIPAIELASTGAKIMQQKSLEVASKFKPDLQIVESGTNEGTKISYNLSESSVFSVSFENNLTMFEGEKNKFENLIESIKNRSKIKYYDDFNIKNADIFRLICGFYGKTDIKPSKVTQKKCALITIVGCGFLDDDKFKTKLQKIKENNHFFTFLISITPTTVKIACKNKDALSLTKAIHNEFIKE